MLLVACKLAVKIKKVRLKEARVVMDVNGDVKNRVYAS
jgi:hypothetical protein